MTTQTIDHSTLTKLTDAGVVQSAHAIGQVGGWGILVKYGVSEGVLSAQRSQQVRVFRKLETLVDYLRGVGIRHFVVDAANYDKSGGTYKRPDRTAALKNAHQAAAYATWLKAEVQAAIDDTSPSVAHDEAMRQVRSAIKQD